MIKKNRELTKGVLDKIMVKLDIVDREVDGSAIVDEVKNLVANYGKKLGVKVA